jgi:AcrR family transcriptional regulator
VIGPGAGGKWTLATFARRLGLVVAFNTLIAVFMVILVPDNFWSVLLPCQCIGLSIFSINAALGPLCSRRGLRWLSVLAIPLGGLVGIIATSLITEGAVGTGVLTQPTKLGAWLGGTLVFGSAITYYFHSREELAERKEQLQQQEVAQATQQQRLAEAHLKLLQAQMEPHFLFNTLSNILGLIDDRPAEARRMLANLTSYLRGSLQRTREGATTLGDEVDLLRAYLEIQAVRMGGRLHYAVEVADELRPLPLAPLLLQPLVENAVRHGLEPRIEGGEVEVRASREGDGLVLRVRDTGVGLTGSAAPGIGLANVRSRLQALHGERASMVIRPNKPQGLVVELMVPLGGAQPRA